MEVMRRFVVSGTFAGTYEVVYEYGGLLGEVKYMGAVLEARQRRWLQDNLPVVYDEEAIKGLARVGKMVFVEESYEVTFEQFWEKYDMKYNRKRAENAWMRLSKVNQVRAYMGIGAYQRHLDKRGWKNKAHADTYLTQKFWETEWHKVKL